MGVRWDAVVQDKSFWSELVRPASDAALSNAAGLVTVQVFLYGSLAEVVCERPVTLRLHNPFCVDQVIAELGRCYGADLLARIATPDGAKRRNCRAFVNGEPVADAAAAVPAQNSEAQVELVLLSALEGG